MMTKDLQTINLYAVVQSIKLAERRFRTLMAGVEMLMAMSEDETIPDKNIRNALAQLRGPLADCREVLIGKE